MKVSAILSLGLPAAAATARAIGGSPRVQVNNGTLAGVYNEQYKQDYFLGVPFGQPPVGPLRFRNPVSLNGSWTEERDATKLAPGCIGYPGSAAIPMSEDCLYLNVYRPAGPHDKPLPVLVWIFGGGYTQGSATDQRYNMTFMVDRSVEIGRPMIAININYRVSAWGFLGGQQVADAGDSNFGLRDQRLALNWVHENIAAFGGDPSRVTIWGQSAGSFSVMRHLAAYNGRDDKLFSAAIMDSGQAISNDKPLSALQPVYDKLVERAGCSGQADTLVCLRGLSTEAMNKAINSSATITWGTSLDYDFIARNSHEQFQDGKYVRVPIIAGGNTNEGYATALSLPANTTVQFRATLPSFLPDSTKDKVVQLYPLDIQPNALPNLPADFVPPAYPYGLQYIRQTTYLTDARIIAPRRGMCQKWAELGLTAFCFHFNAVPAWSTPIAGAQHGVEYAFAMYDLLGTGYAPGRTPPFQGLGPEFTNLAKLMSGDFISFVNSWDPNNWVGRSTVAVASVGAKKVENWPKYTRPAGAKCRGAPMVFKYDANITSTPVTDDWRKEAIEFVNTFSYLNTP